MEAFERLIAPIEATILTVSQTATGTTLDRTSETKTPSNKNIVPQRRLFSTKKKATKKNAQKISHEGCNKLSLDLVLNEFVN